MVYKVFLFEPESWLYCSDVTLEDGVYHGTVINGNWHLMYDTIHEDLFACRNRKDADNAVAETTSNRKLIWTCDPHKALFDYTTVIIEAKERFESGEPANFEVTEKSVDDYYEDDGIAF